MHGHHLDGLKRHTMNINDIVTASASYAYQNTKTGTQAADAVNTGVQAGLQKAEKRIQSQVDVTTAQLSSFGKLKSAVSDTQLAARALGSLPANAKSADVKAAAVSFVGAFNSAINTAKTAAAVPGETAAAQRASVASRDLVRVVGSDIASKDALKKIGISLNSNGSMVLDAKKFEAEQLNNPAGVQAALSKLGQQVDKVASKELASDGSVGVSLKSLTQRASILKNQQASLAAMGQNTATAKNNGTMGFFGYGLSAYQNS